MDKYDGLFKKYGAANNIDWLLLKAQVKAESNFNPNAKSPVGALGLAQFMKATWLEWQDGTPGIQIAHAPQTFGWRVAGNPELDTVIGLTKNTLAGVFLWVV